MRTIATLCALGLVAAMAGPVMAEDTWLSEATLAKADAKDIKAADAAKAAPDREAYKQPCKPPPLPLHTLEGLGGALTVPMAYLVNCGGGAPGTGGGPTVSYTFVGMPGRKNLQSIAVSQVLCQSRLEVSYAVNRFYIGNLQDQAAKLSQGAFHTRDTMYLHQFNLRGVLVPENTWGPWMPQVTAGFHAKYNSGIKQINEEIGRGLTALGYQRNYGFDYTLTLSKTFIVGGTPLIVSGTLRNSTASNMGLTGFSEDCQWTFEGCAAWVPFKWLAIAYEFNHNNNPYHRNPGLVGKEENRHGILVAWLVNEHLTIAGAWGYLGEVGNTDADCVYGIQVKYEF